MSGNAKTAARAGLVAWLVLVVGWLLLPGMAVAAERTAGQPVASAWLRLGHLSPGTGPVDVWLTPYGATTGAATQSGLRYGTVTGYRPVPPGFYTVAMRPVGSSAVTPAMLTGTVHVVAGAAYSALAEGLADPLRLVVTQDDLTAPAPGQARVRVVQASSAGPRVDLVAVGGSALLRGAPYGSITGYNQVGQGRWTLSVNVPGAQPSTVRVDLRAGSVSTLLVLNGAGDSVTVAPVTDAMGPATMPAGGVETGGGGTASTGSRSVSAVLAGAVAALLLMRRKPAVRSAR